MNNKIFLGKTKKFLVSIIGFGILSVPISAFYIDPTLDPSYYLKAIEFLFNKPIKTYQLYDSRTLVKGNEVKLAYEKENKVNISKESLDKAEEYAKSNDSLSFMVVHNGKIVRESYFQEWNENLSGESESMAKSVLALLIGIAIDEGKIKSENDPVSMYLEEWKNDERRKIKIKDLLQMTSGLRKLDSTINPWSDLAKLHIGKEIKELSFSIPAEISPGRKFDYNNFNSQILGLLLERVTGKKYYDYLSEKIWKPLGASDAEISVDKNLVSRSYCCLFAKTRDWAKLGLLILNKGEFNGNRIVSEDWINKMITPSPKAKNYGLHIWLANSKAFKKSKLTEPFVDESMVFFDGRSKQRVFILPKENLVIVRTGDTSENWKEDIIPNILVRDLLAKKDLDKNKDNISKKE